MDEKRGSAEAIRKVLRYGNRISVDEMATYAEMAGALGGSLASVAYDDDDWCGNGIIILPWPPRKQAVFVDFLNTLVEQRINYEVLINGIVNPDHLVVNLHRYRM